MTSFQKNLSTLGIVFITIVAVAKYTRPSIIGSFSKVKDLQEQVTSLSGALSWSHQINADFHAQYDNLVTTTTTDRDKLQRQLDVLLKGNDSLKILVNNLQGQLTSVGHIHGVVNLGDTATAVVKDSIASIQEPFIDISFNQISKRFKWSLQAYINTLVVEKTDALGNKRQVVSSWLISPRTGDTLIIPTTAEFTTYKEKIKLWHLWNPRIHSDVFFSTPIQYGLSMNIASFGLGKYVEKTYFYFPSVGISTDFKKDINLIIIPLKYNLGTSIPLITNLNFSGIFTYGITSPGKIGIYFGFGLTH